MPRRGGEKPRRTKGKRRQLRKLAAQIDNRKRQAEAEQRRLRGWAQ